MWVALNGKEVHRDASDHRILIQRTYMQFVLLLTYIGMCRITTFRSKTDRYMMVKVKVNPPLYRH